MSPEYTSRPAGSSATSVQKTVARAPLGFNVKTRQQPFEVCVKTRTNVTPAGSALGTESGSGFLSAADDVQVWSESDITKQGNASQRILSMPMMLGRTGPTTAAQPSVTPQPVYG